MIPAQFPVLVTHRPNMPAGTASSQWSRRRRLPMRDFDPFNSRPLGAAIRQLGGFNVKGESFSDKPFAGRPISSNVDGTSALFAGKPGGSYR